MKVCLGCGYSIFEDEIDSGICIKDKKLVRDIQEACQSFKDRDVGKLRIHPLREIFSRGWVVFSDSNIEGSNLVALVFLDSSGITLIKFRGGLEEDRVLGSIGLDYMLMRRKAFKASLEVS